MQQLNWHFAAAPRDEVSGLFSGSIWIGGLAWN
jgi:hypothetical protein